MLSADAGLTAMKSKTDMQAWLRQELENKLARSRGCTEPAAIGLAAARAARHCSGQLLEMTVWLSVNIYKNAAAVQIPGLKLAGPAYAAALGFVAGDPAAGLAVFAGLPPAKMKAAQELAQSGLVKVRIKPGQDPVYIEIRLVSQENKVRLICQKNHTDLSLLEVDGQTLVKQDQAANTQKIAASNWTDVTLADLYDFACHYPLVELSLLDESIFLGQSISQEGLLVDYGLKVGQTIWHRQKTARFGLIGSTLSAACTAAACDARMAGAPFDVIANSGSGNQGLGAVVPLIVVAKEKGLAQHKLRQAVALSHLVTIYIKERTGSLSSLCGALAAAAGASCGLVLLQSGDLARIEFSLQNTLANLAGIICDGAKASCALKLYSCTAAACLAAELALADLVVQPGDGFVTSDPALTVQNYGFFARSCSQENDRLILQLMDAGPDQADWD